MNDACQIFKMIICRVYQFFAKYRFVVNVYFVIYLCIFRLFSNSINIIITIVPRYNVNDI